jgi:bifunctional non-homologous end joining protein LigD
VRLGNRGNSQERLNLRQTEYVTTFSRAGFIQPMLLLPKSELLDDAAWLYELKLDGYRAVAFKTGGRVQLRSRDDSDFSRRCAAVCAALRNLPDESVIDGEIVALDEEGRPSFNLLQNHGSTTARILYYVFDVMVLNGRDVMGEPLTVRRELLAQTALKGIRDPIRLSPDLHADLRDLIESVKAQGLKGLVSKRRDSRYEPGMRSGARQKMRVNLSQEFVIGGYTVGGATFDAIIFGRYEGDRLLYVSRTRSGFTPALRQLLAKRFRDLEATSCPFAKSDGNPRWPLGRRLNRGEDEGLPLAEARTGWTIRVRRMDSGQPSEALPFCWPPR